MKDGLGDRIKGYEAAETGRCFLPLLPVVARLDGRCFSTFTAGMDRPFDFRMQRAMIETAKHLVEKTHPLIAYTQSDEITLVWEQRERSSIFFDGIIFKMTSVLAAMATARFLVYALQTWPEKAARALPEFDCRVFQVPTRDEAANAVLWREQDATKNAITQAAQAYYSHKQLHGKSGAEKQDMLWVKGVNFNDYPSAFKRGTFLRRVTEERPLTDEELARIPERYRPDGPVLRSRVAELEVPPFGKVLNRVGFIFEGEDPRTT